MRAEICSRRVEDLSSVLTSMPWLKMAARPAMRVRRTMVAPKRLPKDSWGVPARTELMAIEASGMEVATPKIMKPVMNWESLR
ncbi:MAG: hypothetical protein UX80_C0016G0004 [Candidatus Amesbacteria bacterium GW2011_GWA2_47_11b]|uniref:Uncharacterized protein n=2 Tax=Candidatus Amesiibacteriota TaxID=1752730 RepID=A0A0G1RJZ7_9BACT|nr:MAG: hypothetical protein UX80_C0016G0004 [Candidatus Amesbacteria bacterium GW2011_GWA2_47_11b]KKU83471.1 MAG: hypothetical protein UY11_C0019G0016 [Candidatus Amesbacteria bacterium GW2011_GWC2_47_8]